MIEINLEKPADLDALRDGLVKAGFEEPLVQNFGSSRDVMVRMPPTTGNAGRAGQQSGRLDQPDDAAERDREAN